MFRQDAFISKYSTSLTRETSSNSLASVTRYYLPRENSFADEKTFLKAVQELAKKYGALPTALFAQTFAASGKTYACFMIVGTEKPGLWMTIPGMDRVCII
jgi:hypothetical protein